MTALGNKEVMSKNLKYYIEKSGKDRKELAEIWGFPYSTVTEWVNGKKYPRIDRIEIMADYFGILKSDLIEEKEKPAEVDELTERKNKFCEVVKRMSAAELDRLEEILRFADKMQQPHTQTDLPKGP